MAKFSFVKGETSLIIIVFIQDNTATDGSGLAGLDHTSGIAGSYIKRDSVGVAVAVDEDVAAEGTYQAPSNAAHIRIGKPANSIDGVYEFHLHNDHLTTKDYVNINLDGAADMAPLLSEVQLTDFNLNDASPQVTVLDFVANAITAASINAAAFTTAKFAGDFLTNALIADDAFAVEQFKDAFLTAAKIAGDAITNAKIADNTLDTEQFANGALTVAKFAIAYALASECTAARLSELDAANMPADLTAIGAQNIAILVDTAAIIAQNVAILVDTGAITAQNVLILVDTAALLARIVGTLLAGNHNAQTGDSFGRLGAPVGASLSADVAAVLAALPRVVRRNQALANFPFVMLNIAGTAALAGEIVVATRSIDGGAYAPCANAVVEVANGSYEIDFAGADVNGVTIIFRFAGGILARDTFMTVLTQA